LLVQRADKRKHALARPAASARRVNAAPQNNPRAERRQGGCNTKDESASNGSCLDEMKKAVHAVIILMVL